MKRAPRRAWVQPASCSWQLAGYCPRPHLHCPRRPPRLLRICPQFTRPHDTVVSGAREALNEQKNNCIQTLQVCAPIAGPGACMMCCIRNEMPSMWEQVDWPSYLALACHQSRHRCRGQTQVWTSHWASQTMMAAQQSQRDCNRQDSETNKFFLKTPRKASSRTQSRVGAGASKEQASAQQSQGTTGTSWQ